MQKKFIITIGIALLMSLGCQSDKIVEPGVPVVPEEYDVVFVNIPENVSHLSNQAFDVPIEVVVHKKNGDLGSGARVEFYLTTQFGTFVSNVDSADIEGRASATLRLDPNKFGVCKIFVLVPGGRVDGEFQVRPITLPARMNIIGDGHIKVMPGRNGTIQFGVTITDSNAVEVPGVPLVARLSSYEGGAHFGVISADLLFNSLGGFGGEWLVVTTNMPELGTQISDSVEIMVERLNNDIMYLTIRAFPNFMNIPRDSTGRSEIRMQVHDSNNIGVRDVIIDLITEMGTITTPVITDSSGLAKSFWESNGESGTAHITVRIRGTEWEVTLRIIVITGPAARLTLHAVPNFLILPADSIGMSMLYAQVTDENHVGIAGVPVRFVTDLGSLSHITPTDSSGVATAEFRNNYEFGTAHIIASIPGTEFEAITQIVVEHEPYPPTQIDLTIHPDTVMVGMGTPVSVTALVTDSHGNPVEQGTLVRFSVEPGGDITPSAVTDEFGRAVLRLIYDDNRAGIVVVHAYNGEVSDSDTLWILAEGIGLSDFRIDPPTAQPGDSVTISVRLVSPDHPLADSLTVIFVALGSEPPGGASFPNGESRDSARTVDGVASIRMNVGENVGGRLLKIITWRDPATRLDTISVILSTFQVVAGPPAAIDIDINGNGEDAGDGNWRIAVSARVYDRHLNPVGDVDVIFSVSPDSIASVVPGRRGSAWIIYHGGRTFNPITITASVDTGNGEVTASREYRLPLQGGHLELTIDPQNWMFDRGRPNDTCLVRVTAVLEDGQGTPVNNMPILFRTDRARLYWRDEINGRYRAFYPEAVRKYTGIVNQNHNEPPGTATVYLRGRMEDGFLDDFSLEVIVHIEASVEGYDVSTDPGFVFFTRH